jgi:hypothetical protein
MKDRDYLELIEALATRFDDASVKIAMDYVLHSPTKTWRTLLVDQLVSGRTGAALWKQIQECANGKSSSSTVSSPPESADNAASKASVSEQIGKKPTAKMIRLAESQLIRAAADGDKHTCSSVVSTLLLATGKLYKPAWLRIWSNSAAGAVHQGWVIPTWLEATNCDRRSFDAARRVIKSSGQSTKGTLFRSIAQFARRKNVARWTDRFLRRETKSAEGLQFLCQILEEHPTKRTVQMGIDLLRMSATARSEAYLLVALLAASDAPEVIEAAKQYIADFPNAPKAFELACLLEELEPDFATPWLEEWNKTAMDFSEDDR